MIEVLTMNRIVNPVVTSNEKSNEVCAFGIGRKIQKFNIPHTRL